MLHNSKVIPSWDTRDPYIDAKDYGGTSIPVINSINTPSWSINHSNLDPAFLDLPESKLCTDVLKNKYQQSHLDEKGLAGVSIRVAEAICPMSEVPSLNAAIGQNILARKFMPAGRILAGAGTGKRVTLMNCYVNGTIEDSMEGISDALRWNMLTLQQGGGMGTCFSTIRPTGAILKRTFSDASGPLPFMDVWDVSCATMKSAGDRRGAMMGTISDTHPDLLKFVHAKHQPGKLTNFNVSVLISDAFMAAVQDKASWYLYFNCEPMIRDSGLEALDFYDDEGVLQYVYSVHKADELWNEIMQSTYKYSEPGILFIDRINALNNLNYCELIQAPNPCGEQPLPPHGACNLAANNLAYLVRNPFTKDAQFDWRALAYLSACGVMFLDRVIDASNYPLPEQEQAQKNKRRVGLGFAGLADAMAFLGLRYGSEGAAIFTENVQKVITANSYRTSILLAKSYGSFPEFNKEEYISENQTNFASNKLPKWLRDEISKYGIRNSVLNTIAPTGTTAIAFGNTSSGLEPTFAHVMRRKVLQEDNTFKTYEEHSFTKKVWDSLYPNEELPSHCVTANELTIWEHLRIQAACQKWVDASISKTINCPEDMPFEQFVNVYQEAYDMGCKGCTTYRPSDVRGSILDVVPDKPLQASTDTQISNILESKPPIVVSPTLPLQRAAILEGKTLKIKWPGLSSALYLTINFMEGKPYEVFFNSKDQKYLEWMTSITILLSWVLRQGMPLESIAEEFRQVTSVDGGQWVDGKYQPSFISYIGQRINDLINYSISPPLPLDLPLDTTTTTITTNISPLNTSKIKCPECHSYGMIIEQGCAKCLDCGYSKCS